MASLRNQLLTTYAAEGVNLVSGLAFGIMSARALEPAGRGVVAAVWAVVTIGMMISGLGVAKSLVSRLNDRDIQLTSSDYYGGLIVLLPVLSLIAWGIIIPFAPVFSEEARPLLWFILILIAPVMLATEFARSVLRARRRIYILNGITAGAAIARVGVLGTLWYLDKASILTVLMIETGYWMLIGVLACFALADSLKRSPHFSNVLAVIQSLLSYGLMFQAYSTLFNMVNKINIPVLNAISGAEITGYFAVSVRFAEYLGIFTNQILFILIPFLAQKEDKLAAFQYAIKLTRISVVFLVPAGIAMVAAADWCIPLLYGEAFAPSVAPFRVMVLAIVTATLFQLTGIAAVATGKLKMVTACAGIGLCVNAILMFILIPYFGALGAAMAAVAGHITSLTTHLIALKLWFGVAVADVLLPTHRDFRDVRRHITG